MSSGSKLFKFGNHKIGDDTVIFNMGTALTCPSKELGLCQVTNKGYKCYARKSEIQYKEPVLDYRERQKHFWQHATSDDFLREITRELNKRRKGTKYFRFNESGDFFIQSDINKLSTIARELKILGITTFGFSARSDLDFSNVEFLIKGSGHNKCPNGRTEVIERISELPEGYTICPGDCRECSYCKENNTINIGFLKH